MNKRLLMIGFAIGMLMLSSIACEASASTASISNVGLTADPASGPASGTDSITFTPDQTFYAVVSLANAPDSTKVKAVWYSVDEGGVATKLAEKEVVGSGSPITFNASNNAGPWPTGAYRVEIYLNDTLNKTIDFTVVE